MRPGPSPLRRGDKQAEIYRAGTPVTFALYLSSNGYFRGRNDKARITQDRSASPRFGHHGLASEAALHKCPPNLGFAVTRANTYPIRNTSKTLHSTRWPYVKRSSPHGVRIRACKHVS